MKRQRKILPSRKHRKVKVLTPLPGLTITIAEIRVVRIRGGKFTDVPSGRHTAAIRWNKQRYAMLGHFETTIEGGIDLSEKKLSLDERVRVTRDEIKIKTKTKTKSKTV